ncbi:MAG: DUF416 family protein [Hahellaceae bacterium]|nr:DUF416 family protein [Hahellaceae bacterium]
MHDRRKQARQFQRILDILWESVGQRQPKVWLGKELDEEGLPKGASALVEQWSQDLEQDESFGGVAASHSLQLIEGALLVFQGRTALAVELGQQSFNFVTEFVEMQDGEGMDDEALVKLFESSELCQAEMHWQRSLGGPVSAKYRRTGAFVAGNTAPEAANDGVSGIGVVLTRHPANKTEDSA